MWKIILENLIEYRYVIIFVIGVIVYAIENPSLFKRRLVNACLSAKQLAKDGVLITGKAQEDWVVNHIDLFIGRRFSWVLHFIPDAKLRGWIKELYTTALDILQCNYLDKVVDGTLNK